MCVDHAVGSDVVFELPLDDLVIVGYRKDFGDITKLAKNILTKGLINPIMLIGPGNTVLSGERRVAALRALGETKVRAVGVKDYDDARIRLLAERGNLLTKPMLYSEMMRLENLLRTLEKPSRGKRMYSQTVGFSSGGTYQRTKLVYDKLGSDSPEIRAFAEELMNKVDAGTLSPTTACSAIQDFEANGANVPKGKSNSRTQVTAIRNGLLGLEGITTGLESVFDGGFERSCTRAMAAETAAALAGYSARLNRVVRRLRAYGTEQERQGEPNGST
jgi:hypothetical protein